MPRQTRLDRWLVPRTHQSSTPPLGTNPATLRRDSAPQQGSLPPLNNRSGVKAVRVLQFNMMHCWPAHDLFKQKLIEGGYDVGLVAEPILTESHGAWIIHPDPDAKVAIWVKRPEAVEEILCYPEGIIGVKTGGYTYVSVYFSPNNNSKEEYEAYVHRLANISTSRKKVIIGGDLNAKSHRWSSPVTNSRADITEELIDTCNLHLLNNGNKPTCVRHNGSSFVDITLTSENIIAENWEVLDEEECHSDHRYIQFTIRAETTCHPRPDRGIPGAHNPSEEHTKHRGWILKEENVQTFENAIKTNLQLLTTEGNEESWSAEETVTRYTEVLTRTCDDVLRKKGNAKKKKEVYWWNDSIMKARAECNKIRRKLKSSGHNESTVEKRKALLEELKAKKKELRKAIAKSKEAKWEELLRDLNRDPWSLGYKIAMGKLEGRKPTPELHDIDAVVEELFPRDHDNWEDEVDILDDPNEAEPAPFTPEELAIAMGRVKPRKAAGPDEVSGEIVKACYSADPERMLDLYNKCLSERAFPKAWKIGRLVLIPKPNTNKYRPLTMLPVMGKIYENLISERVKAILYEKRYLSDLQFGFRTGKSTGDALRVLKTEMKQAIGNKKHCAVVSFDIKNAFNTVRWKSILEKLQKAGVPVYLRKIIREYGANRVLIYVTGDGSSRTFSVNRGVPQGSVLGPLLWNITYNDVLKVSAVCLCDMRCVIVGFADDTLLIIAAEHTWIIEEVAEVVIGRITEEVLDIGCEFAGQKTAAILASHRTNTKSVDIRVNGVSVEFTEHIKYLGVMVDRRCNNNEHVKYATDKTNKVIGKLRGILRNNKGPTEKKRRLYSAVCTQVMLYAAPVWSENLLTKQKQQLNSVQRKINIKQIQGYITVGQDTACVMSGNPPADLIAEEYVRVNQRLNLRREEPYTLIEKRRIKHEERIKTTEAWEGRWAEKTNWLRTICESVESMNRNFYNSTFYTSQLLTGKGVFGTYRKALKKAETDVCWYCSEADDPAHTLFHCPKWALEREEAAKAIPNFGQHGEFLKECTSSREAWTAFKNMAAVVMQEKEKKEREIEQEALEEARRARAHAERCVIT